MIIILVSYLPTVFVLCHRPNSFESYVCIINFGNIFTLAIVIVSTDLYIDIHGIYNTHVSNIAMGSDYTTSVNTTLNDNATNINKGDISNEKGVIINNIISNKDHLETSKQARYNSRYLHN